jgi:NAD(P)-dependent dehydrogenase (short-subunit alcohol dehydrogenase family)
LKDFDGKIAFITGGASGAGLGQARVFAEAGCKIVLADLRREALDAAASSLRSSNAEVHPLQLDVTDRAAFARAADEVERVLGRAPDLLFNTAGVNTFGPLEKSTYEDFDWLMGVNLGGVVNGMQTFVPRMIKAGRGGHIVTTASVGGFEGSALAGIYSAAKAAVINLMEGYRMSLEKYGIGVSVLCPANIKSNIAEATKTRPAHLASSGYVVNDATIKSLHGIYSHGMEPTELAKHVKRGIEENQLYIIPYPEVREGLETHFAAIVASVLPLDQDPVGAKKRTEALRAWQREFALVARSSGEDAG